MAFPMFLIPLLAQAAGTGLGFLQRGQSLPRIDMSPAIKAARLAGNIPSASTVMQRGRSELGEQFGAMRSQIGRLARETNLPSEAFRTIEERAFPQMFSTYIQGMGRTYGQAIDAASARAQAAANAAQLQQQATLGNANIAMQEEQMRPNPLQTGAMFGQLAGNIMNIKNTQDWVNALKQMFSQGTQPSQPSQTAMAGYHMIHPEWFEGVTTNP